MKKLNLINQRFGRWLVIKDATNGRNRGFWECLCDCGNVGIVSAASLRCGNSKSCGCYKIDRKTKHNMSKSPEYSVWAGMHSRCNNKNLHRYNDYGGRGISVCDRWKRFDLFIKDMGLRPSKDHSIDRIDNNGNYEPKNCKWSTRKEQQANTRPTKKNNKFKRGDEHWTRKDKKRSKEIAIKNIKKAHGKGENNPNSKMTHNKAVNMRHVFKNNKFLKMDELGAMFGVKRETARKVVKGEAWL